MPWSPHTARMRCADLDRVANDDATFGDFGRGEASVIYALIWGSSRTYFFLARDFSLLTVRAATSFARPP